MIISIDVFSSLSKPNSRDGRVAMMFDSDIQYLLTGRLYAVRGVDKALENQNAQTYV